MMENYMVWVWLGVFILTIVIESITQELVSIWFAVGALIALVLSAIPNVPWYAELIVFAGVSFLTMVLTRPFVKRLLTNATRYTNIDEFIGKRVPVMKDISKFEMGEIKLNGIIYSASLTEEDSEKISAGEIVEIVAFKGNKVVVRKIV